MHTGANTRSSTLPVALGTGLPVVAIRGVETDDLFIDGVNVLFADRLSGDSFAAAVLALAERNASGRTALTGRGGAVRRTSALGQIGDQLLAEIDGNPGRAS